MKVFRNLSSEADCIKGEALARELDLPQHSPMVYRRCGLSGLHVSAIAMGLHCRDRDTDAAGMQQALIQEALDLGVNHFDLSATCVRNIRTSGRPMDELLGPLREHRHDIILAAHIGFGSRRTGAVAFGSRKDVISSLDSVLKGLSLDYVDILYSDRHDPNTPLEETMEALAASVRQGKALYVGLSGYAPAMARKAIATLRRLGTPPVVCQASFSVLNPWAEDALLDILRAYGVSFVADNPLASGALRAEALQGGRSGDRGSFANNGSVTLPAMLSKIAADRDQSISQLALSWVLQNHHVSAVVIDPEASGDLLDLCSAVTHTSFSAAELETISALAQADPYGQLGLM